MPLSNCINTGVEFQHRRQNGLDNRCFFDSNLMSSFRSWIHYRHSPGFKISLSPFAYFKHHKIIVTAADRLAKPNHEIRCTAAAEWQHAFFKEHTISYRTAVEFRYFTLPVSPIARLRNRLGMSKQFNTKLNLMVYDELLLNIAGAARGHYFDHNRVGILCGYKFSPVIMVEMGYIYIKRLYQNAATYYSESNITVAATCTLPVYKNIQQNPVKQ